MAECKAAMLPTVRCNGITCLWLENEIHDGSLSNIVPTLKKEDPAFLQKIVDDKVGPLFRTCAKRQLIESAALQALAQIKSKK